MNLSSEARQSARLLVQALLDQGHPKAYLSLCCGRLFVGAEPAIKCSTCDKIPNNLEAESPDDLSRLVFVF